MARCAHPDQYTPAMCKWCVMLATAGLTLPLTCVRATTANVVVGLAFQTADGILQPDHEIVHNIAQIL